MPVLVRNSENGPTVFTDSSTNTQVEWQGAGDPSGEDVQQVPDVLVENVAFLKAVQRGIFVIEEASDATRESLAKQTASWQRRTDEAKAASVEAIDPSTNEDLITLPCVGPSNRGAGQCGEQVPVREKTKDEKPALCSRHAALSSQFILSESDEMVDGVAKKQWIRTVITTTERQMVPATP